MAFWSRWLRDPDLGEALRTKDVKSLLWLLPRERGDPLMQIQIIRALADAGDAKAVFGIAAVLGSRSNTNVCVEAVRALRKLDDVRAVPALVEALDDERRGRETLLRSNEISDYSDARPTIVGSRSVVDREVPRAAEAALRDLGAKAVPSLAHVARRMVRELQVPGDGRLILKGAEAESVDIDQLEKDGAARELLSLIMRIKLYTQLHRPTLR